MSIDNRTFEYSHIRMCMTWLKMRTWLMYVRVTRHPICVWHDSKLVTWLCTHSNVYDMTRNESFRVIANDSWHDSSHVHTWVTSHTRLVRLCMDVTHCEWFVTWLVTRTYMINVPHIDSDTHTRKCDCASRHMNESCHISMSHLRRS